MTTLTATAASSLPHFAVGLEAAVDSGTDVEITATLRYTGDGDALDVAARLADTGDAVIVEPSPEVHLVAGIWRLILVVTGDGHTQIVNDVYLLVEAVDGWHSIETAREDWTDAPRDERRLAELLDVAREQVIAFAPTIANPDWPPASWRLAQLTQARNIWNGSRVDPSGAGGVDGFALAPFPLDWQVKQLLRPRNPRPTAT